jgi:hypothetical protein
MKQNDVSEPCSTDGYPKDCPSAGDWPSFASYPPDAAEPLLRLAHRLARLPLAWKKILAMYYYENLPISGIATGFNVPAWRIADILAQTVDLFRSEVQD